MGKPFSEQYDDLLERYKAGIRSEELLAQLFRLSVEALSSRKISDFDLETSVLMCEILKDCVGLLRDKCEKYDFSRLTSKDLVQIHKNLGHSPSDMKDAIALVLRYRLYRVRCGNDTRREVKDLLDALASHT